VTVFDGSNEDESKLAKQFWNSVVLIPPVESTLVCKEIKQRTRSRTLNDGTPKRMFISFRLFFLSVFFQAKFSTTTIKTKKERSMRG
jgi:hypothetical protein